jgi:hypothetical protein
MVTQLRELEVDVITRGHLKRGLESTSARSFPSR